jgi:hypothetical protein
MKNWKAKIEYKNKLIDVAIEADTFSEAYINISKKYPGCEIISLSEVRKKQS